MIRGYFKRRGIIDKRLLCIIVIATILSIYFYLWDITTVPTSVQHAEHFPDLYSKINIDSYIKHPPKKQACIHPRLDPSLKTFSFYRKVPSVKCTSEQNWVYTRNGKFYISSAAVAKHGVITCDTVAIEKSNADGMQYGFQAKNQLNNTELHSDHFKVKCLAADGKQYKNVHSGINKVDRADLRGGSIDNGTMGVSVLMLGIDSLSRPMLQIQMPRTHDLFVNKLGGQLLEGYNIVGDGTPQALIPMLTGSEETQLPETRKGYSNAQPVDCYPFIWKDFEKKGYATHFFEDASSINTFNVRLMGFRNQPTHHYMRPFYIAADNEARTSKGDRCLGSIPMHELGYNSLKQSFHIHAETGTPIFALNFLSELSHGDNNLAQLLDNSTADFLQHLYSHGYLRKTVIMLFSDHGSRFSEQRRTERGKLEERMPYVGFLFPKWFDKKFPIELDNFKANTKRLASPFDIHATLKHIIYPRKPKTASVHDVGISLFDGIPPGRTCAHAHIEAHWCACLNWQKVSTKAENAIKAAKAVVEHVNSMLLNYSEQCNKLALEMVQRASVYKVENAMLKFDRSLDRDGRKPSFNDDMKSSLLIFQVTFVTKPGNGTFEATVEKHIAADSFKFISNEKDISRLNKYGSAPECIASRAPHLRAYCYCK